MLKQEIQEDLNKAIKGKNGEERSVLRLVLASILNKEKEKRYKIIKMEPNVSEEELKEKFALSDQEIIQLLFYEIKKRKEAVLEFKKGNRPELATQEENEVKILEKYLPEQISEEEIKRVVTQKIIETNANTLKDIGLVIKKTMAEVAGKAEAGIVGRIAKDLLSRQ